MLNAQLKRKRTFAQRMFFIVFLLSSTLAFAQHKVTGTVTDKAGDPLIGVNVLVKGTTMGSITDLTGKFSVEAERGEILVFTFIGFIGQEVRADQSVVNIVMEEDARMLDEVVVVGYGVMTRKDVTSSITTVSADKLNVGVYSDPAQLLQGKVPGLTITQSSNPNATPSITLRGASTLRTGAAMEPYYVIDGVPGMSLSLVAPDDIESIDVLRDATATAIYGSKAANGVIIVSTKKGKAGQTSVNYSGYVAVDNVMNNYEVMNAAQLRSYAASGNITLPNDLGADTRWRDEVQRTGFSHNHHVSISGGSGQTTYNAGVNYMERQGVIKGTEMDRLIGRAFLQSKALKERLTLSFSVNTSVTNNSNIPMSTQGQSVLDAMYYYSPLVPVRNDNGGWYENSGISQNYNPVALIEENIYNTESKRIQGTGKAALKIIDGLVYNLSLAYQNEQNIYSNYNTSKSLMANGMDGKAERSSVTYKKKVLETYLNYDKTFNDVHKLGLMGGYSWEESNDNDGFQLTTYGYYNDDLTYHNMGMANKIDKNGLGGWALSTLRMISFYGRLNYAYAGKYLFQATVRRDGSSAFGKNNRWATFPSVSLAWRLSEESFIKDLGVFDDLKLRAGYGISGNSLGFDVFTATQIYGATGWYDHLTSTGESEQIHIIGATRNANPDLKWERTGMFNIGLDFGFFNNRLSGTIEYYDKRTKDLIADYAVSTTKYQHNWLTANVGEISNKGVELTINVVPVKTKDLTWETSLNLSHNENKVVKLSNEMYSVDYFDKVNVDAAGFNTATIQRVIEGYPIGQFYLWKWAGVKEGVSHFYVYGESSLADLYKDQGGFEGKVTLQADGRYKDKATGEYVTTNKPLYDDRAAAGSAQPKLTAGWNNSLYYRNWTLTLFFQGVFGNKILNASRAFLNNIGHVTAGKNVLASIADENPVTDNNAHAPSDRYIENGSYVRLSSLTLGYNFGRLNDYIKGLRLYATCNNVFTLTGYKGIDPEVNLGGIEPGIDNRQTYPRTRTFMFGVNVNF
jgi:iron complex outermembrane receptor protein